MVQLDLETHFAMGQRPELLHEDSRHYEDSRHWTEPDTVRPELEYNKLGVTDGNEN